MQIRNSSVLFTIASFVILPSSLLPIILGIGLILNQSSFLFVSIAGMLFLYLAVLLLLIFSLAIDNSAILTVPPEAKRHTWLKLNNLFCYFELFDLFAVGLIFAVPVWGLAHSGSAILITAEAFFFGFSYMISIYYRVLTLNLFGQQYALLSTSSREGVAALANLADFTLQVNAWEGIRYLRSSLSMYKWFLRRDRLALPELEDVERSLFVLSKNENNLNVVWSLRRLAQSLVAPQLVRLPNVLAEFLHNIEWTRRYQQTPSLPRYPRLVQAIKFIVASGIGAFLFGRAFQDFLSNPTLGVALPTFPSTLLFEIPLVAAIVYFGVISGLPLTRLLRNLVHWRTLEDFSAD